MAEDAKKKGYKAAVIEHQHNNFCGAAAQPREAANASHPFKVLFLGGSANQLGWLFQELQAKLAPEFPYLALEAVQISGSALMEGFQRLAKGDLAVVWDQCKRSRFNSRDCLAYKPNTRAAAALSAGLPTLMYGEYAGHRELAIELSRGDEHQKRLLVPSSASQLGDSISAMLRNVKARRVVSERGHELGRRRYDIRMIAVQYLELLVGKSLSVDPDGFNELFRKHRKKPPKVHVS
mmetsp:Transcript_31837/g.56983  ORF Transcript_31837/g.56983 Transcript_31837/m.56983 type:complete len:236 (-) Transcript_31837:182-889(-)|eukprot:CAMPEP_0177762622 /NCGR_PEP_ID=MMETSP0491_2-20121128/6442_1 /TAXON_ID=63592 /ORGANISM="Tetraselmis chuii, Strain PLY429" /LENGTH=235 /DNA_ID=CAMNT_0019278687 /DNA_START=1527 /DNA_END=2234 /DNA_ORIENTATION=+